MLTIHKNPIFENDSYFFQMTKICINEKTIESLKKNDAYLSFKFNKFSKKDWHKDGYEKFSKDRPSLKNVGNISSTAGSTYTYTVEEKNLLKYPEMMSDVKKHLDKTQNSRRAYLRVCDNMRDYIYGDSIDVSCLSNIHYLKLGTKAEPTINLIFRASDIKHELFPDIILVYWFFIKPVFKDRSVNLNVFASTSQNIDAFKHTLHILHNVISNTTEKLHK